MAKEIIILQAISLTYSKGLYSLIQSKPNGAALYLFRSQVLQIGEDSKNLPIKSSLAMLRVLKA